MKKGVEFHKICCIFLTTAVAKDYELYRKDERISTLYSLDSLHTENMNTPFYQILAQPFTT